MTNRHAFWPNLLRLIIVTFSLTALLPWQASAQQSANNNRFEGTLLAVWGDPRPGLTIGATRFSLALPDGTRLALNMTPAQQNQALQSFGKAVIVEGRQTSSAAGAAAIAVDAIRPGPSATNPARASEVRRVLYILLRFNGDSQQPHPPQFFKDLTNPKSVPVGSNVVATLNGYYSKTSYGYLKWRADVAGQGGLNPTNWLTLPKTKMQYAPCGWSGVCADLNGIEDDAFALVEASGVDLSVYDNINFVLNNDLDCCAWGGGTFYNGQFYGATWEPPWGQEAGIYAHELGHSIGLPHSGWVYFAYDSPWDDMSSGSAANSANCGSYFSANSGSNQQLTCTEPGSGFITAHKDHLGWIPAANKVVIDSVTSQKIRLEPNSHKLTADGIKMIKVCYAGLSCTGNNARYLTIEARVTGKKFEDGLPGEGVIIHDFDAARGPIGNGNDCFFNSQSGWAVPADATAGDYEGEPACNSGGRTFPNYALYNAQFTPGMTYRNQQRGITVKVNKRINSDFVVTVTRTQ